MTQLPDIDAPSLVGTVIEGKYLLERELGAGGMGAVYLARHKTIEREVAIKLLHRSLASDASIRRRFETEARAIARLSHPNCVMLYEFGLEPELEALYAVFEYVRGHSLEKWAGKTLAIDDVLEVGRQVVGAIGHAHDQGIIHRDLKPDNIMVTIAESGKLEVKVLDFGIARITEDGENKDESRLTKMGQMFGTPPYMSPEQIKAKLNVTFATDIYSIGVILYELIEGRLPFLADSPIETVLMHLNEEVPPMVREDLPEELRQIVMRCLQKDAEDRFGGCAELSAALDRVVVISGEITELTDVSRLAALDDDAPKVGEVSSGGLETKTTNSEAPDSGQLLVHQGTELEFVQAPTLGASPDSWQGNASGGEGVSVSAATSNAATRAGGGAAPEATAPPRPSETPSLQDDAAADSGVAVALASTTATSAAPAAQQPGRAFQSTEDMRAAPQTWPELATGPQRLTLVTLLAAIAVAAVMLLGVLYLKSGGDDAAELSEGAEAAVEEGAAVDEGVPASAGASGTPEDGDLPGDGAAGGARAPEAEQTTSGDGKARPEDGVAAESGAEGRAQSPDGVEEEGERVEQRAATEAKVATPPRPTTRKASAPAPEASAEEPEEPTRLRLNRARRITNSDEPESTEEPSRLTLPGR